MARDEDALLLPLFERARPQQVGHRRAVAGGEPLRRDFIDLRVDRGCGAGVLLDFDAGAAGEVDGGARFLRRAAAQAVRCQVEEGLLADLDGLETEVRGDLSDAGAGADEAEAPTAGGAVAGEA